MMIFRIRGTHEKTKVFFKKLNTLEWKKKCVLPHFLINIIFMATEIDFLSDLIINILFNFEQEKILSPG